MTKVMDPVCGMRLYPDRAPYGSRYRDRTYYLCSPYRKRAFDAGPERYPERNRGHHHRISWKWRPERPG